MKGNTGIHEGENRTGDQSEGTGRKTGKGNGKGRGAEVLKGRQGGENRAKFPHRKPISKDPKREEKTKNPHKKTRKRKRFAVLLFVT